jgi:hypothetical protein
MLLQEGAKLANANTDKRLKEVLLHLRSQEDLDHAETPAAQSAQQKAAARGGVDDRPVDRDTLGEFPAMQRRMHLSGRWKFVSKCLGASLKSFSIPPAAGQPGYVSTASVGLTVVTTLLLLLLLLLCTQELSHWPGAQPSTCCMRTHGQRHWFLCMAAGGPARWEGLQWGCVGDFMQAVHG